MKTAGIICEFNPFHDGHKYLIHNVRRDLSPDAVVCIMSGNYVQRGEPAFRDKRERADAAIKGGADLVLQMPTFVSLSSAKYFAKGSVDIAKALGIDHLCFGSESGDILHLLDLAQNGISEIEEGNNILACEYLRNLDDSIRPYTLRIDRSLGSASDIRKNYVNNFDEVLFDLIRYKIITSDAEELAKAPEVSEGLENKLLSELPCAADLDSFKLSVKSKRYTYTRISRMLIQVLLGIKSSVPSSLYAHLLAFNEKGQELLSEYKHSGSGRLKIYTNITPEDCKNDPDLALDVRADDIYSIICGRALYDYSDYVCKPVKTKI